MANLKDRVERLETQVSELQSLLQRERGKDWRRAVDKYAGDRDLHAVLAEAMRIREADRRRTRAGRVKRRGNRE